MKARKVLKPNNLPAKFPIFSPLTIVMALDFWNAPQWLWGAMGLLIVIFWIATIHRMVTDKKVDLFKNGKP